MRKLHDIKLLAGLFFKTEVNIARMANFAKKRRKHAPNLAIQKHLPAAGNLDI